MIMETNSEIKRKTLKALKRSHFRSWFEPPPSYVIARGPKAVAAYQRAKETGKILDRRVKVLLIGQDRVGKTSVGRSLKGEPFRANETSTDGVQMHTPLKNPGIQPWKFSVMQQEMTAYHHKCAEYIGRELFAEAKAEETRAYKEFINTFPRPTKRPRPTNRLNHESLDLILDLTEIPDIFGSESTRNQLTEIPEQADDNIPDEIVRLLDGKQKEEFAALPDGVWPVIWDLAGQAVYRAIHPIFMSPEAVYILVFDLTKELTSSAQCKVRTEGCEEVEIAAPDSGDTSLDHIMRWLDLVHSLRQSSKGETLPPVVLVGTHADCANSNRMIALRKFLSRNARVLSKRIAQTLTVDNTRAGESPSQEDRQIVNLREEILKAADTMPHTNIQVPLKWLEVENKVYELSKQGEKYTTRQRFKMEIFDCQEFLGDDDVEDDFDDSNEDSNEDDVSVYDDDGDDDDDVDGYDDCSEVCVDNLNDNTEEGLLMEEEDGEDDFEHLLNFLHDRGTIVYHDSANNPNGLVVLDPQWLIDVLCKIVTVKEQEEESLRVLSLRQDLLDKGILHAQLLEHVCKNLKLDRIKDSLLFIMKKFNLLCECKNEDGISIYLVPCMLTTKPADDLMGPVFHGSAPVFITFDTNYVPAGLFSRLLVLFGEWAARKTSCEQQQFYANAARFFIGKVTCLGFACCKTVIKIHLWTMDNSNPAETEPELCSEVSSVLRSSLERLKRECHWLRAVSWQLCGQCKLCPGRVDPETKECYWHQTTDCLHDDCAHYVPVNSSPFCCAYAKGPDFRISQTWIQALCEDIMSNQHQDAPPTKRSKVVKEECERVLTEEVLDDLSRDIGRFWKSLGLKLKVPNANIDEIQADQVQYPGVREKSFQMLMVWFDRGESVTVSELSRSLKALGKDRLAKKYCGDF